MILLNKFKKWYYHTFLLWNYVEHLDEMHVCLKYDSFFHDSVDIIKELLWYMLHMSLLLMFYFLQMSSLMSPIPETGSTPTIGAKRIQKPGTAKPLPG